MKIVQVCHRYYPDPGGVEKIVQEISERMAQRGHSVEVVTTDPSGLLPEYETINMVNIVRFRSFAPQEAYYFPPGIYSYLKNVDCDLIHAHNYHAFPALIACMARNDHKLIISPYYHGKGHTFIRNLLFIIYNRVFGAYFFNKADMIISPSDFEAELLIRDFKLDRSGFLTIAPGVDDALFDLSDLKKTNKNHSILFVGRIEEYKGLQYVIRAMEYISDLDEQEFVFNIVGSGPYKDRLQKIAEKKRVKIIWHGHTSKEQLYQQYREADLLILLSRFETFGIVVAEALASKVPALVVKNGALGEFVDDNVCFSVENPDDAKELGDKILEICKMDIDFSGLSDRKVRKWAVVVDEYERAYKEVCQQNTSV